VIWGAEQIPLPLPASLRGAIFLGDAAIEKYRLLAVVVGLVVFAAMFLTLNRTKIGLLIRAGVENGEMVEAWATASAACSWACSRPVRRWPAWAA
jgi:branched-chain amino acid transport system permease protein